VYSIKSVLNLGISGLTSDQSKYRRNQWKNVVFFGA
jgi:hypothetical protein